MHRENKKTTTSHIGAYLNMGTVVSCDPGTMNVTIAPDGQQNMARIQGIPLAATFAHALGFKETVLPQVGSRVLCYGAFSGFCLIVGTVPPLELQNDPATAAMPNKQVFAVDEPLFDKTHSTGYYDSLHKAGIINNQMPTDVVQGEKVITNEFGVLLGLFQLMAVLKGSELSQVQCHFLDDLVRIISHNFQHYHALGAHNIFHDGKGLHMEVGLTHNPIEALGTPQTSNANTGTPAITDTGSSDKVDFYSITNERLVAIERLKLFVGKLGDFINLLIVSPGAQTRSVDGTVPTVYDRGLLQLHAGLDGLLIVRSVKGIVLEKTNWIRVPTRIRTPEDPAGDDATQIDYKLRSAFGFDNTYTDSSQPFLYYLQLRDYLAQIEEDLNYSNFNAHPKDFFINGDYTKETPLGSLTYVDPITGTSFLKKRSVVALMPNGGLSLSDAWGSAINMDGGNIYIQPAKDLFLQPMRHMVAKVGGNVSMAVNRDIDISSTTGGLRTKTALAQQLYSDKSGIVLQANGPAIPTGTAPYNDPTLPISFVGGVALIAPNASVASYGSQVYLNGAYSTVLRSKDLFITSDNVIEMLSKSGCNINSRTVTITAAAKNGTAANSSIMLYSQGSATLIGDTSTIVGIKDQTFAVAKFGVNEIPVQGILDKQDKQKDFFTKLDKIITDLNAQDPSKYLLSFQKDENFTNTKFLFPPSSAYGLTDSDIIPQTMVQLEEATFTGLHGLDKWVEKPVNGTYPYPGADKRNCFVATTMKNVNDINSELVNKATGLVTQTTLNKPINLFTEYTVKLL